MVALYKEWILRFIHVDKIEKHCYQTDIANTSLWVNSRNIIIGEKAKRLLNDMIPSSQLDAFSRVKSFYLEVAVRLKQYLQFENKIFRNCSALCPTNRNNKKLEKKFVFLAEIFPSVVPQKDLSNLRLEVRVLQSSSSNDADDDNVVSYWTRIQNTGNFPVLSKLVRAILIIPHGNADVERVFSNLSDVVQKKRQSLSSDTINALVVSRSCLKAKIGHHQHSRRVHTVLKSP